MSLTTMEQVITQAGNGRAVERSVDVAAAWHELGRRLRAYVSRRVPSADADDIVQNVMVKLLESRGDIVTESVRAWLFTVTRNAVAEYYRRQRPALDLDTFDELPDKDSTDTAERAIGALADCLDPVLGMLTTPDAELLRKIDIEGQAQTILAADLGVPLSTLKSRVQRARTKLRAAFDACCAIDLSKDGAPIDFERGGECAAPACAGNNGQSGGTCSEK